MIIQTTYVDGSTDVARYENCTEEQAFWHAEHLIPVWDKRFPVTVKRLRSLQAAQAIAKGGMVPTYKN